MEVAPEALLVGQAGDPHHHRVGIGAVGEEPEAGGFTPELVLGVVDVGEVLDLGDREQAADAEPQTQAEDGLLVQRVSKTRVGAEALLQAARDAVDTALAADVLAEHDEPGRAASSSVRAALIA